MVEDVLTNYVLARELKRLNKKVKDQADKIEDLTKKFQRLKKFLWPLVKHHRLWVKSQKKSGHLPKKKSTSKKKKLKKQSPSTLGRNLENLNGDAN